MVLGKIKRLLLRSASFKRKHDKPKEQERGGEDGKKKTLKKKEKGKEGEDRDLPVCMSLEEQAIAAFEEDMCLADGELDMGEDARAYDDAERNDSDMGSEDGEDEAYHDEDEDDDDGFVGEFEFEEQPKSFECLSPGDIVAYQEKEIRGIADLLSLSPHVSATLLRYFHWKREKLVLRYFENPQQVCKEAGVPYNTAAVPRKASAKSDGYDMCSVCGDDDITPFNSSSLACAHVFCNDCWANYLTTKINEGDPQIRCPHLKCTIYADDVFIKKLVQAKIYEKYLQFVTKSFVQENDRVRWCPTPGCNNAVTFDQNNSSGDNAIVQCACGYKFCFKCHREAHVPATCDQMKMWEQKCQDDSETFNWKSVNCRECPRCSVAVEKNGGCNHMTCRQCKYEWCWVCMRAWKGHNDFYSCNRFEKEMLAKQKRSKSKKKKAEDEKERKRAALERYLHYYERYVNHENSRKLEVELRASAMTKMREMHDVDSTWAEVQFIERSVAELQDCRTVLKYTYVFAFYYLEEGKQNNHGTAAKDLFEYLQEDLEKTTERLSEIIEGILKTVEIENAQKLESINQTNLAKTKRENLLTAVARDPLFEVAA